MFWPNCGRFPQTSHLPLMLVSIPLLSSSRSGSGRAGVGRYTFSWSSTADVEAYHKAPSTTSVGRLLDMISYGQRHLEAELAVVNGLNVFPVPDGDTGTNMRAT